MFEATIGAAAVARLKRGVIIIVVLAALALSTGFCLPGGLLLSLTPVLGGRPLVRVGLEPGEHFTLRYIHSVEHLPVWETHRLDPSGRIHIVETRYLRLGAGMGQMPGVGRVVHRGPYEVIENMHMPTGDFVLRIGSEGVDHTLIWRNREINLTALAPHSAVRFAARPINRLQRMWFERIAPPP